MRLFRGTPRSPAPTKMIFPIRGVVYEMYLERLGMGGTQPCHAYHVRVEVPGCTFVDASCAMHRPY